AVEGFVGGLQIFAADVDRHLQLGPELEQLLLRAGRPAQGEPGAIDDGNRTVEEPHAQILELELALLVFAAFKIAEVELGGIDLELSVLNALPRQLLYAPVHT